VVTAGRLILYRSFGKLSFGTILDSTEKIQIMFHRDNCKIDISTSANEPNLVDSLGE
jgi:lysyl-tRNA synthetase class II